MVYQYEGKTVFESEQDIVNNYELIQQGGTYYIHQDAYPWANVGDRFQVAVGEQTSSPTTRVALRLDNLPNKIDIEKDVILYNKETREYKIVPKSDIGPVARFAGTLVILAIIALIMLVVAIIGAIVLTSVIGATVQSLITGGKVETSCPEGQTYCTIKYPDGSSCTVETKTNKIIKCSGVPFFGGIAGIAMLAIVGIGGIAALWIFGPRIMNWIQGIKPEKVAKEVVLKQIPGVIER